MRLLLRLALFLAAGLVTVRLLAPLFGGRRRGAYYLTGARQIGLLFWPLAGLVASLPFVLGAARRAPDLPPWALGGVAVLGAALLSLSVPALVLHAHYRRHDGETVVFFDPAAPHLDVQRLDRTARVVPAALAAVQWVRPRTTRAFWGRYEYLVFTFTDGTPPLRLTSLPLELAPVVAWLRQRGAVVEEVRRGLAWGRA